MILTCPACNTRYLVPDTAIGATGRQVRCASCRHSWFQEGIATERIAAPDYAPAEAPSPAADSTPAAIAPSIPQAVAEHAVYGNDEPAIDPDADPFAHAPPFRPRRNPAKLWTLLAVIAAAVMLAGTGALVTFGPPDIAQRLGLWGKVETPLIIDNTKTERRPMASGNELFSVSGRIVNPSDEPQKVPDIQVYLLDAQNRIVFSWSIARPVAELPAKGSVEFNNAVLDVPSSAKSVEFSVEGGS